MLVTAGVITQLQNLGGMPVIESWTGQSIADNANFTLTEPTGVTAGDLLVLVVGSNMGDTYAYVDANMPTPSGWTKRLLTGLGGSVDGYLWVFTRTATGTEGNPTVSYGSAKDWVGWYFRISGGDTAAPLDVSGGGTFTSGAVQTITGVTTTQDNCLVFYALENWGSDCAPFSVSGTGFTELDEEAVGTSNDISGCVGTKEMPTAGATGNASVTCNVSSHGAKFMFAIAPA